MIAFSRPRLGALIDGALMCVLVSVFLACMTPKRVEPLSEAVRAYNEGVRWQRFEVAASYVLPENRDTFLDRQDRLTDDLRINDFNVIRVREDASGRQARVHVKLSWYRDSRGVVRETHLVQSWRRDGKRWVLIAEEFLRGDPWPAFAEPDEPGTDVESGAESVDHSAPE